MNKIYYKKNNNTNKMIKKLKLHKAFICCLGFVGV